MVQISRIFSIVLIWNSRWVVAIVILVPLKQKFGSVVFFFFIFFLTKNISHFICTSHCLNVLDSMNNFKTKKLNFEREVVIYIDEMPTFIVMSFNTEFRYSTLMVWRVNTIFLFIVFNRCAFHKNWKLIYILMQFCYFVFHFHSRYMGVLLNQDFMKFPRIVFYLHVWLISAYKFKTFTITTDIK